MASTRRVHAAHLVLLAASLLGLSACLQGDPSLSGGATSADETAPGDADSAALTEAEMSAWSPVLKKYGVSSEELEQAYAEADAAGTAEDVLKRRAQVRDRFMPLVEKSLSELSPSVVQKILHGSGLDIDPIGTALIANPYSGTDSNAGDSQCRAAWSYWRLTTFFGLTEDTAPCGTTVVRLNQGTTGAVRPATSAVWDSSMSVTQTWDLACIHVTADNGSASGRFGAATVRVPAHALYVRSIPVLVTATSWDVSGGGPFGYYRTFGSATVTSEAVEHAAGGDVVRDRASYTPDARFGAVLSQSTVGHVRSPLTNRLSVTATQWLGFSGASATTSKEIRVTADGYVDNYGWGAGSADGQLCSAVGRAPIRALGAPDGGLVGSSYARITWYAFEPAAR